MEEYILSYSKGKDHMFKFCPVHKRFEMLVTKNYPLVMAHSG